MDCFSKVVKEGGFIALYRGLPVALAGVVLFKALFMGGYDTSKVRHLPSLLFSSLILFFLLISSFQSVTLFFLSSSLPPVCLFLFSPVPLLLLLFFYLFSCSSFSLYAFLCSFFRCSCHHVSSSLRINFIFTLS